MTPLPAGAPSGGLGHVLLSSMRDEGPFALEFVAHHRAIGFDRLFIASNDCRDGTDVLLDALDAVGAITHHRSVPGPGDKPQHRAYAAMRALHGLDRADWLMVLDADEFLHVSTGAGRVQDLTAAAPPGTDIIALNARSFGTTPDPRWHRGLVTEQFTLRLRARHPLNGPVKSLARDIGRFQDIHNHSMVRYGGKAPLQVMRGDGSLFFIPPDRSIWDFLRNVLPRHIHHDLAHYNHYAIKSLSSFCLRQDRGRGAAPLAEPNQRHTDRYFDGFAAADQRDLRFVRRYGAALRAEYDRLLALPGVAAAQAEAERRYGALIKALL
ncbi:glycosyltransferase family 2 protein [Paracoccus contaminans]|nr:glycosyltransferase family 2 protein [Paracoccus contaminans]